LKVLDYIDEEGNPTSKAKGMLMLDHKKELTVIKPKGTAKLQKLVVANNKMIQAIARMQNLESKTSAEVTAELIRKNLLKK